MHSQGYIHHKNIAFSFKVSGGVAKQYTSVELISSLMKYLKMLNLSYNTKDYGI